jgi:hypothetical protein
MASDNTLIGKKFEGSGSGLLVISRYFPLEGLRKTTKTVVGVTAEIRT